MFNDFENKTFDVMFKVGKPKFLRLVLSALIIKYNLKNHFTNISFSSEPILRDDEYDINKFWNNVTSNHDWSYTDLSDYLKKIPIQTYLGASSSLTKTNKISKKAGYTFDLNSYAEIYMESDTCSIGQLEKYPNLVSFTEKTFNNFFHYKIPLAVDTRNNIEYLRNIGFKFPIEPCYIEENDDHVTFYNKLDSWVRRISNWDFKKVWEDMYYSVDTRSALHNNHFLCKQFLSVQDYQSKEEKITSKPQYIATYKFIEMCLKDSLDNFINWDYQTYLFLKNKKLL
jgi:hypothetical protein